MIRDFFDETGVPILYLDNAIMQASQIQYSMKEARGDIGAFMKMLDQMIVGAYDMMGRLGDIPLTSEYFHTDMPETEQYQDLFRLAYQSGSIGYYFGDTKDHLSTTPIPDEATRNEMAAAGRVMIEQFVSGLDMPHIAERMRSLEAFERQVADRYPWVPSAAAVRK
jgi:creatinine amidohydrolase